MIEKQLNYCSINSLTNDIWFDGPWRHKKGHNGYAKKKCFQIYDMRCNTPIFVTGTEHFLGGQFCSEVRFDHFYAFDGHKTIRNLKEN